MRVCVRVLVCMEWLVHLRELAEKYSSQGSHPLTTLVMSVTPAHEPITIINNQSSMALKRRTYPIGDKRDAKVKRVAKKQKKSEGQVIRDLIDNNL